MGRKPRSALGGEEVSFGMGVSTRPHPLLRGTKQHVPGDVAENQKHRVVGGFVDCGWYGHFYFVKQFIAELSGFEFWLCPALLAFFPEAPQEIFVKVIGTSIVQPHT